MALSDIVNVAISAGTAQPTAKGFGVPLILAAHTAWTDTTEVRTYTDTAGVLVDFASTSLVYQAAAAIFSQPIRPEAVKVGRIATPSVSHTTRLDFTDHPTGSAIVGSVWFNGVTTAINVPWTTNLATTLAALDTAIEAVTGAGTVTTASPQCTCAVAAGVGRAFFSFNTAVRVVDITPDSGYDTALAGILARDPAWFWIVTDIASPKNIDKIARWALTNDRMYVTAPQVTRPADWDSSLFTAGADLTALNANPRAWPWFTKQARPTFLDAAFVGRFAAYEPGSATGAYKSLTGIGADAWTSTERATIEAAKANHYTVEAGLSITRPGKVASGEWGDVVIGLAWMTARLQERIFAALANAKKIPYTDAGLAQVDSVVRGVLRDAQEQGIIDAGWTSSVRPVSAQTAADRTARTVRGVAFNARLSGAIHMVNVAGTVTT